MIEDFYLVQFFIRYEKALVELYNVNAKFSLKIKPEKEAKQHG